MQVVATTDLLIADYHDVVIDGPPRVTDLARSIILAADIVVIPLQPSPMDFWAAAKTVDLVWEPQVSRPEVLCCQAVNRTIANTAIGREALVAPEVPVLKSDARQPVAFAESAATGTTVLVPLGQQTTRIRVSRICSGSPHRSRHWARGRRREVMTDYSRSS